MGHLAFVRLLPVDLLFIIGVQTDSAVLNYTPSTFSDFRLNKSTLQTFWAVGRLPTALESKIWMSFEKRPATESENS